MTRKGNRIRFWVRDLKLGIGRNFFPLNDDDGGGGDDDDDDDDSDDDDDGGGGASGNIFLFLLCIN